MIDFTKINSKELEEVMIIVQKNIEKSELEKYYLFSITPIEKAKMFIYCYRFFKTISNLMSNCTFKMIILNEIKNNLNDYNILYDCVNYIDEKRFGYKNKLIILQDIIINHNNIDEVLDAFTIFMERTNVLQIEKMNAFVLEGKSEEEFKKVFNAEIKNVQDKTEEDFKGDDEPETSETETDDNKIDKDSDIPVKIEPEEEKKDNIDE